MPYDGSGNFNRTFPPGGWQGDAAGSIKIRADRHDQHDADLAQGLSNAICRDGQSQVTANIPMNAKKITNLGTPTAPTDAATKAYVDTAAAASIYAPPIGAGMEFWGPTPPAKWVLAYGQALSRVTYSQLFALFGTLYGGGDGSTTFNMPDVRGRVVAAADNMGGTAAGRLPGWVRSSAGGAQNHTLTIAELAAHTHPLSGTITGTAYGSTYGGAGAHTHLFGESVLSGSAGGSGVRSSGTNQDATSSNGAHEHTAYMNSWSGTAVGGTATSTGSGAAHNNTQPTIAANYIIYAGV